jgi:hypothetical protein
MQTKKRSPGLNLSEHNVLLAEHGEFAFKLFPGPLQISWLQHLAAVLDHLFYVNRVVPADLGPHSIDPTRVFLLIGKLA